MSLVLSVLKRNVVARILGRTIPSLEVVGPDEECLVGVFRRHLVPILLGNVLLDDASVTNEVLALVQVDDLAAPLDELVLEHGQGLEILIPHSSGFAWYVVFE